MNDLVIFDCDGVLVDSEILAAEVLSAELAVFGVSISPDEVLRGFVGLDERATFARIEERYGVVLPNDFASRCATSLRDAFGARLRPMQGIQHLLAHLAVPYCVASNSSHQRLRVTFASTGLAPFVEGRVFSADDVARGKPAPDLFLHAAARMGARPENCMVIEDSITGVQAARSAGMSCIGFCGGSHFRHGHDLRLAFYGAEAIARSHDELFGLLPVVEPLVRAGARR